MPHALLEESPQRRAKYAEDARQAELISYTKLFPYTCFIAAFGALLPLLLLDQNSELYSRNIALNHMTTVVLGTGFGLAGILGLVPLHRTSNETGQDARTQIILGAVLLVSMATSNALLLIDSGDPRHAGAGVLTMIAVTMVYPRLFGVLLVSVPQVLVVTWLSIRADWSDSWSFALATTLGGAFVSLVGFFLRQAYFRRHRELLAERANFIAALKTESAQRAILQERVLTERNLATLGRLAGGIAHDLNNILVPILGNAAMLEESVHTSTHKRQAREVVRAATRARSLTKQLGFFSARGGGTEFETLELNELLAELCPIVWRTLPQGIDININPQKQPIYLRVNRPVLQDILTNLLLEAGNAAQPGTSVSVDITRRADLPEPFLPPPLRKFCTVAISDGAPPMSAEERAALFQPEQVGDRGVGIRSASDKAEALGAFLDVDLASDGSNRFRLFLPIQTTEADTPAETDHKVQAAVAPEVLVVDDEDAVRRVTVQLLKRAGFVVRECNSGENALKEIENHLPDVIVMDLRMPGMGGRAATEAVKAQNPSLPVVVCTGFAGDADGWLAQLPGCALLQKPYDTSELTQTVHELLNLEFASG